MELQTTSADEVMMDDDALTFKTLTGLDRCDRDATEQAVAQVLVNDTLLLFCGHHWRDHADVLIEGGFQYSVPEAESKPMTWRRAQELGAPEQRDAGSAPE